MSTPTLSRLLSQLAAAIGRESAQSELRWMRQTLEHPSLGIIPSARSLEEMVSRRVAGEPLQYILGSQPFGPLNLAVRPPVLIPRPETEDWALRLAEALTPSPSRPFHILDICTGTGCIPLLLCHHWPPGSVHAAGLDISREAIALARENAALCGITAYDDTAAQPDRTIGRANTFTPVLADIMAPDVFVPAHRERMKPPGPYDLITSNPPYIPKAEYDALPSSVKDYEDVRALLGDVPTPASGRSPRTPPTTSSTSSPSHESALNIPDDDRARGLTFYHRIAALVGDHGLLRPGAMLALEVGAGQASAVAAIVERRARLDKIDIWKDPWGVDRVVVARK